MQALLCQGRPEVYVTLGTQDNPRNGEKSSERAVWEGEEYSFPEWARGKLSAK